MDSSNEATRLPEDYPVPDEPRPVDMAVIDRERELMQLQGTQESYDLAMEAYNQLPADKRKVFVEGEEVSADTLIKEIDDQLEDINNLIRCVRGE
jgi:predicted DNA-binding ribbon-helix-helix protein